MLKSKISLKPCCIYNSIESFNFVVNKNVNKVNYSLYCREKQFKKITNLTYFYKRRKKIIKKFKPIDINGIRCRLNLATGEYGFYTRELYKNSLRASVSRTKNMLYDLCSMNDFKWFVTLTFDNARVDRYDNEKILKCYMKFIDNIDKQFPSLYYVSVPEQHEDGAIHFHIMMGGIQPSELGFVNSGKVCCSWAVRKNKVSSKEYFEKTKHEHELKETDGLPIYNITKFIYGFSTATKIANKEACDFYVRKYLDKALGSTEFFKKRFYYSKNCKVPEVVTREIGSGLMPTNLDKYENEYTDSLVSKTYYKKCNTLTLRINNENKTLIDNGIKKKGLTPIEDDVNISTIFNGNQINIEDIF